MAKAEDRIKDLERHLRSGFKRGKKQFTLLWRYAEGQAHRTDQLEKEVQELREEVARLRRMYLYGETGRRRRPKDPDS